MEKKSKNYNFAAGPSQSSTVQQPQTQTTWGQFYNARKPNIFCKFIYINTLIYNKPLSVFCFSVTLFSIFPLRFPIPELFLSVSRFQFQVHESLKKYFHKFYLNYCFRLLALISRTQVKGTFILQYDWPKQPISPFDILMKI